MPRWTPDGKYLLFASDRDGGGLYALPLQPETARADDLTVAFVKPKTPITVGDQFPGHAGAHPTADDTSLRTPI